MASFSDFASIAGGGILGGLVSGIFGSSAQKSANRTNLQIARETNESNERIANATNEANYKLWQEQQAHELDMWNKENDYNDPSAQRARLEAAGYNPMSLFDGDFSAGSIATSAPAPAEGYEAVAPPPVEPYNLVGQAIDSASQLSSMISSVAKTNKEIEKMDSDIVTSDYNLKAMMQDRKFEHLTKQYTAENLYEDYMYNKTTRQTRQLMATENLNLLKNQVALSKLNVEAATISNKYLDKSQQVQYMQSIQNLTNSYLAGEISRAELKRQAMYDLKLSLEINGIQLRNEGQAIQNQGYSLDNQGKMISNSQASLDLKQAYAISESYIQASIATNMQAVLDADVHSDANWANTERYKNTWYGKSFRALNGVIGTTSRWLQSFNPLASTGVSAISTVSKLPK